MPLIQQEVMTESSTGKVASIDCHRLRECPKEGVQSLECNQITSTGILLLYLTLINFTAQLLITYLLKIIS